jgi:hypothetical protein
MILETRRRGTGDSSGSLWALKKKESWGGFVDAEASVAALDVGDRRLREGDFLMVVEPASRMW